MARFPLTIVSPQNRAALQALARFFQWLFASAKANWRSFLIRFVPLWLPLLLIWLLPMPHEIARQNGLLYSEPDPLPFRHADEEPDNLGAQLVALDYTPTPNRYPSDQEDGNGAPPPPRDKWIARIEKRFHQPWLRAYLVAKRMEMVNSYSYSVPTPFIAGNKAKLRPDVLSLRSDIEAGLKAEPNNAFWPVERAWWEWNFSSRPTFPPPKSNFATTDLFVPASVVGAPFPSSPGPFPLSGLPPAPGGPYSPSIPSSAMTRPPELPGPHPLPPPVLNQEPVLRRTLAILRRAQKCTFYEDGIFRAEREIRDDQNARHSVAVEDDVLRLSGLDKSSFLRELRNVLWSSDGTLSNGIRPPYAPMTPTEPPIARLQPGTVLQSGAAMAHIGGLIDRLPDAAQERTRRPAFLWFDIGWNLDVAPLSRFGSGLSWPRRNAGSVSFAKRARAVGENELARHAIVIEAEIAARDALWKKAGHFITAYCDGLSWRDWDGANALIPPFAFQCVGYCFLLSSSLVALCAVWMFLNIWLCKGVGAPSSWGKRWGGAFVLTVPCCAFGAWALTESVPTTGKLARLSEGGLPLLTSVPGVIAVLTAIICATLTVLLHRREMINVADDKWHTKLLPPDVRPWVEPILLVVSALLALATGLWFAWMTLTPGASGTPLIGGIATHDAVGALALYCGFSGALSFGIWLINWNWRWPPQSVAPITHSGLRWWKECIGASICILAWLYLFVALAAWPARAQAKRMIAERWQTGDWVWLQKNL